LTSSIPVGSLNWCRILGYADSVWLLPLLEANAARRT
jgi:hypothetical protein